MTPGLFGIDFGHARVGIAGADDLGLLAHPRATLDVKGKDPAKVTAAYLQANQAHTAVVGLPLTLAGEEGSAAQTVRQFADKLQRTCPHLKIIFQDESLTTVIAADALRAAGKSAKQARPIIDQAAAREILQTYLDCRAHPETTQPSDFNLPE